ncbi:hypothetical protein MMPV_006303 [Pyropia vietnamensis]
MVARMLLLSVVVAGAVATTAARPVPEVRPKSSVKQEFTFEELPTCTFVDPCNGKALFGFPEDVTDSCGNVWKVDWDCNLVYNGPPVVQQPKAPAPFIPKPGEATPTRPPVPSGSQPKPFPPTDELHQFQEFEQCNYIDPCNGKILSGLLEEVTDSCGFRWRMEWDCDIVALGPFTLPKPRIPQRTDVPEGPPPPPKPAKTNPVGSPSTETETCTFEDECNGESISADVGELFVDSCGWEFEVLPGCEREELEVDKDDCTYEDDCNGETISANVGEVLTDSCDTSWTVGPACERN